MAKRVVTRRWFVRTAAGLGAVIGARHLPHARPLGAQTTALPTPVDSGRSLQVCLNSRTSQHAALGGRATAQQIANVLWAAGRAPVTGTLRTIYLTTPDGKFVYRPEDHALVPSGDETVSTAFRITYDRDRDFDAGVSYTFALLAATAQWSGKSRQLAHCPVGTDLNFGIGDVTGLTTEVAAVSSDGSLPSPATDGAASLHRLIDAAHLDAAIAGGPALTPAEVGQLLWAGYGCTPHPASNGRGGLTVPSWRAEYFLTGRIYVLGAGTWRYDIRQGSDQKTRDHRWAPIAAIDSRGAVSRAVPTVPPAACHIVLCLARGSADRWYAMLETGFAAGGILLQATGLGLGCHLASGLTPAEQTGLQSATGIPADHVPHAVVSVGRAGSAAGAASLPWVSRG